LARILITAGPTYEPIDAVRFLGNRSSGRLGSAVADRAEQLGWEVRVLLGPHAIEPTGKGIEAFRFATTEDLQIALSQHLAWCDCLVMSAAVADFRPVIGAGDLDGKRRRSGGDLTIALEPTPDLLAGCSEVARTDQLLVGFALEPRDRLDVSARSKLSKKNIDLIVANPLETMDSTTIDARMIGNPDRGIDFDQTTDGPISKDDFASWLLGHLEGLVAQRTLNT